LSAGLHRLWVDLLVPGVVVERIQLPGLNCRAGRSSSALASWFASLVVLFSSFAVNHSKSLDSSRISLHCFEASRSYLQSSSCALENPYSTGSRRVGWLVWMRIASLVVFYKFSNVLVGAPFSFGARHVTYRRLIP